MSILEKKKWKPNIKSKDIIKFITIVIATFSVNFSVKLYVTKILFITIATTVWCENWSEWSACSVDRTKPKCTGGVENRVRTCNGALEKEVRGCSFDCKGQKPGE